MSSPEDIQVQTINHLGLIAGIIDEIGIEKIINDALGVDKREIVTPGQIVKAIILNGLGFISRPLYLFPQFFEDKATEHLIPHLLVKIIGSEISVFALPVFLSAVF